TYTSVEIDNTGNIWSGNGLNGAYRFNGTSWTEFSTFNSNILHDFTNDIVVDNSNNVWVSNYKGISVYNGTNFTNYDTANADFLGMTVGSMKKDASGKIYLCSRNGSFGYEGVTTYSVGTWTNLTGYPAQLVGEEFADFAFAPNADVWMATGNGFTKYVPSTTTFTFYPYASTGIWSTESVVMDGTTVYAGGFDGIVRNNGSWTMYSTTTNFGLTSNTFFYDLLIDGNILWAATSRGLLKIDKSTMTILVNYNSTNSPLDDNCVSDIERAANGDLWLATTIGVVKMVPSQVGISEIEPFRFSVYPNPANETLYVNFSEQFDGTIDVLDLTGKLLQSNTVIAQPNFTSLDISSLNEGVYIIRLTNQNTGNISTSKFVVTG
ncbi:MAG: T9SS type A sorting domain-containing protein, partial [Flavobacteriales bacterium]